MITIFLVSGHMSPIVFAGLLLGVFLLGLYLGIIIGGKQGYDNAINDMTNALKEDEDWQKRVGHVDKMYPYFVKKLGETCQKNKKQSSDSNLDPSSPS